MMKRVEAGEVSNENGRVWSGVGRSSPGQASEVVVVGVDDPTAATAVMDRRALAQGYACDDHAARVQGQRPSGAQHSRLLLVIPDGVAVELGCLAVQTWEVAVVVAARRQDHAARRCGCMSPEDHALVLGWTELRVARLQARDVQVEVVMSRLVRGGVGQLPQMSSCDVNACLAQKSCYVA